MAAESGKYPELHEAGAALMSELPEGARAFLLIRMAENFPLQELWRSGCRNIGTGGDGKRVLGICLDERKTILIKDSAHDPHMRGIKFRSFASALGVPISDGDKLVGALFVASDQVDAFTELHVAGVEQMAEEYGPILSRLGKLSVDRPELKPAPGAFLFSPAALVSVAMAALLVVIWYIGPPEMQVEPSPDNGPRFQVTSTNVALDVSQSFLGRLREGEYEGAWMMLDPQLQTRWPRAEFAKAMSDWTEGGQNKKVLERRQLHRVQKNGDVVEAVFLSSEVAGDQGEWVWELTPNGEGWAVAALNGPVTSP